jgi:hypothetical protein
VFGEAHLLTDWEDWDVIDDDDVDDDSKWDDYFFEDEPRDPVIIDDGEGRDYDQETTPDDDDQYFEYEDQVEDPREDSTKPVPADFSKDEWNWLNEMPECIGEIED